MSLLTKIVVRYDELVFLQTPKLMESIQRETPQRSKSNENKRDHFIWQQNSQQRGRKLSSLVLKNVAGNKKNTNRVANIK